ncbi:MAG: hypothetical protein B7C54_00210 [Acidimicrobiales bacterium mtb01]|nr:MAG: hypothetical protein B7C54_00210 [Acidimicrobiales bacterium mtb01]
MGLAVLVFALTPGFVFLQRREMFHPGRTYSALRETSIVVVTSLAANVFGVVVVALASTFVPGSRAAADAFMRDGTSWLESNYRASAVFAVSILVVASLASFAAAAPPLWLGIGNEAVTARITAWRGDRQHVASAWTKAFRDLNPEKPCVVGLELEDGTFLRGVLHQWSSNLKEDGDRSLLLGEPLSIRRGDSYADLDAHYVEVSASRVVFTTVLYVEESALKADPVAKN